MSATKRRICRWERRPEARPQELLEAALRVFAERGYRGARLEEVAASAGVSKGALYHYFENKEELLLRAIEHHQEVVFGHAQEVLSGASGPASARIRLLVRRGFAGDDPIRRDVLLLLQDVANKVPAIYRRWLATGPVRGWRLIAELIAEGQADGEFRRDADAEVAARILVSGLMTQVALQAHADALPELAIDLDRLVDSAVEGMLAGLRIVAVVAEQGLPTLSTRG